MTTYDRIAVSISFIILIIGILDFDGVGALCFGTLILYWLVRLFIDDISFDLRRSPKTTNDKADALLKWNELLEEGAITQEEYDKAKRDLLG